MLVLTLKRTLVAEILLNKLAIQDILFLSYVFHSVVIMMRVKIPQGTQYYNVIM